MLSRPDEMKILKSLVDRGGLPEIFDLLVEITNERIQEAQATQAWRDFNYWSWMETVCTAASDMAKNIDFTAHNPKGSSRPNHK